MMETYYAAAIKYERPFKLEDLQKYTWKQTEGDQYINASAPCFSSESIEEFFYCEDRFRDAMQALGYPFEEYFAQWKLLLHDLAKDIWLEVIKEGDPEDNGAPYDEDEDGFIKAMEAYILQFCQRTGAKTLQQRVMANWGTEVAAHMTWFRTILKYTDRLPGDDLVQRFDCKLITFHLFPKAWK